MEGLVELSEQEVKIDFVLGCKCRANVHLRSLNPTFHVAFKVQTSSPHKFLVNPPSGLIPPLSSTTFQLILKPQSQLPSTFPRSPSDRFLVKTALAHGLVQNSTNPELFNSWFEGRTHDLKLGVAFVGPTLLRCAVGKGDISVVKKIIKRGRGVVSDLSGGEAESLMRLAAESDKSSGIIRLLVETGLKTEEVLGKSPLAEYTTPVDDYHVSAFNQSTPQMKMEVQGKSTLVKHTPVDDYHVSAYDQSSTHMKMEALARSDPANGATGRGRSALGVARDKGHNDVVEIVEQGEAVLTAARRGDSSHLKRLLDRDANVDFHDQYGLTALHVAAIKGHKDIVMLLLEYVSELDCRDNEGHTPLHFAVEGGSIETVEVLVNRGANLNIKSKKGASPLYIAQAMGYDDIYKILSERGAST